MSGQRWPNAILEREWLALRWHMQGCWATDVGPTPNQRLAIMLARWAKWHRTNVICRRRANKTGDKMPALAQQIIAIWGDCDFLSMRITCSLNTLNGFPTLTLYRLPSSQTIHTCSTTSSTNHMLYILPQRSDVPMIRKDLGLVYILLNTRAY